MKKFAYTISGFVLAVALLAGLFSYAQTVITTRQGGTGTTSPSGILKGAGSGSPLLTAVPGTDYVANTTGDWTGTLDGQEGSFYIANSFSTTSADLWKTLRNFFSTTSVDHWESTQTARTADDLSNNTTSDLAEGSNLYWTQARFNTAFNSSSTQSLPGCDSGEVVKWSGTRWDCATDDTGSGGDGQFSTTSANLWVQGIKGPFTAAHYQATSTATSTFGGGVRTTGDITASRSIEAQTLHATSTTASSSIAHGLTTGRINTTSTSTVAGIVAASGGIQITGLTSCNTVDTDSAGNLKCGSDETGGGGGNAFGQAWEISGGLLRPTTTQSIGVTGTATNTLAAGVRITGDITASRSIEAPRFLATSSTATSTFSGGLLANFMDMTTGFISRAASLVFGNFGVTGTTTLATTTTSVINGTIVVDGLKYAQTGYGINKALKVCETDPNIGGVYMPAGTYTFTTTLVEPVSNCHLYGAGKGKTILQAQAGHTITNFFYEGTDRIQNFEMSNFTIDGNSQSIGGMQLFLFNGVSIHDIEVKNIDAAASSKWGLRLGSIDSSSAAAIENSTSTDLRLYNNDFIGNYTHTFEIILLPNVRGADIYSNYFNGNESDTANYDEVSIYGYSDDINYHHNFHDESGFFAVGTKEGKRVKIENNIIKRIRDTEWYGIRVFNSYDTSVSNNVLEFSTTTNSAYGVFQQDRNVGLDTHPLRHATTTNLTIRNNKIRNAFYGIANTASGSSVAYEQMNVVIDGNEFYDIQKAPIRWGVDVPTMKVTGMHIKNNKVYSWFGNVESAINLIGASTSPSDFSKVYIDNNYIADNTTGASSGAIRLNSVAADQVSNNHLEASGSFGKLSLVNGATLKLLLNPDDTNGRYGIGTTTPGANFSVQGNALITGTTTVNGLIASSSIRLAGRDCSGFSNGGALTTNAAGELVCSNDDSTAGGSGEPDWKQTLFGGTNYLQPTTTITTYHNSGFLSVASSTVNSTLTVAGKLYASSTIVGTDVAQLAAGEGSLPTYSFHAEKSTGMYRPAAGHLGFSVGNDLVLDLDNTDAQFTYPLTVSSAGTSTFGGSLSLRFASTTHATSTLNGLEVVENGLRIRNLTSCDTVDTDSAGNLKCGSDETGGGGSFEYDWKQTSLGGTNYLQPTRR